MLNRYPQKRVGDQLTGAGGAAEWNELTNENWAIVAAWKLGGAGLGTLAASTALGAVGWLNGVRQEHNFTALTLAIPQRAHVQHLHVIVSGLRTTRAATFDVVCLRLNGDSTVTNYYYSYVYADGVSEAALQLVGTEGYIRVGYCPASTAAVGCYGALEFTLYNYRSEGSNHFQFTSVSPDRTAGAAKRYETGGAGAYWGTDPVSLLTLYSYYGETFICEGSNYAPVRVDVLGIMGKDDL